MTVMALEEIIEDLEEYVGWADESYDAASMTHGSNSPEAKSHVVEKLFLQMAIDLLRRLPINKS